MKYSEALTLWEQDLALTGSRDKEGFVYKEIIIVPSEKNHQAMCLKTFEECHDAEYAILPFVEHDVEVWAIDTTKGKIDGKYTHVVLGR
ncbi:MAG: hypothetical protein PHP76_08530 [Bacteroidales bacterium]|nr:hypothetical protein [Bacteroidales bacterium]